MDNIYYKVVSYDLTSCIIKNLDYIVQYKINEWIEPIKKHTKLLAFSKLKDARSFMRHNDLSYYPNKLYKCHAIQSSQHHKLHTIEFGFLCKELLCEPVGTIFCDKIKLLKEVDKNE